MRTTRILTCLQVHEHHRALETALANLKGSEEAPLFPTDYAANLAVLPVKARVRGGLAMCILSTFSGCGAGAPRRKFWGYVITFN